jgi:hypothetical protein
MSKPHNKDELEVTTYFQVQRNRDSVGEAKPGDVPKLPPTSPWHHDPCGDEPLIEGDSNTMGIPIDQLNR